MEDIVHFWEPYYYEVPDALSKYIAPKPLLKRNSPNGKKDDSYWYRRLRILG